MIKKTGVIIFLLLVTSTLYAQESVWTDLQLVKAVQVMNNGGFMVILDSEKDTICPMDDNSAIFFYPYQNEVTVSGAKLLLSTALIAFTTEIKVKVMYSFSIETGYCLGKALYLSK